MFSKPGHCYPAAVFENLRQLNYPRAEGLEDRSNVFIVNYLISAIHTHLRVLCAE